MNTHRTKVKKASAHSIRERAGTPERRLVLDGMQINAACKDFFRRNGMPEQEYGQASWGKLK